MACHESGNTNDIGDNGLNNTVDDNAGFHEDHKNLGMDDNANMNTRWNNYLHLSI